MAPLGWAELLGWMQERSAAGQLDPEAAWEQFRALSATSKHPGLTDLVVRFRAAPSKDRLALVGTIASVLAPVEWPIGWEDARWRLVEALTDLAGPVADSTRDTLDLGEDEDLYVSGRFALATARDMLRAPCRRDELRLAAQLCKTGHVAYWVATQRAVRRLHEQATNPSVVAWLQLFTTAFATYAEAARAMNAACGVVLFPGHEAKPPPPGAV